MYLTSVMWMVRACQFVVPCPRSFVGEIASLPRITKSAFALQIVASLDRALGYMPLLLKLSTRGKCLSVVSDSRWLHHAVKANYA